MSCSGIYKYQLFVFESQRITLNQPVRKISRFMVSKVAGPPASESASSQNQNSEEAKNIENRIGTVSNHTDENSSKIMTLDYCNLTQNSIT